MIERALIQRGLEVELVPFAVLKFDGSSDRGFVSRSIIVDIWAD
jgi:hypothetical protein